MNWIKGLKFWEYYEHDQEYKNWKMTWTTTMKTTIEMNV